MAPPENPRESYDGTDQPPTFELTVAQPAWWADNLRALEEGLLIATYPDGAIFSTETNETYSLLDEEPPRETGPVVGLGPRPEPPWDDRVPGVLRQSKRLTLTVEEAAEILGISRALAYDAVRRGEIPHIKIGRRILVPRAVLDRMLAASEERG